MVQPTKIIIMNTTEDNKLIAEFDGHLINYGYNQEGVLFHGHHISAEKLLYHTNWNWLMPVVEKIEYMLHDDVVITIEYKTCIIPVVSGTFNCDDNDGFDIVSDGDTKIEAVYTACVEFIKWYKKSTL